MILPIVAFGDPVLRKKCTDIPEDHPNLKELVSNMYETMERAQGVGLAAPQIGRPIRLFIIDSEAMLDEGSKENPIRQTFINAEMLEETGEPWN